MGMIEAVKMPQPRHAKILPQAASGICMSQTSTSDVCATRGL